MDDLSPQQRDKHARILEAAIAVFAEKGFHQARISDVARRAGVADGTIYLYFRNKDDLLLSLFEEKMDELLQGLHDAVGTSTDPRERIARFAAFHFGQVEQNRALAEVLQVELRLSNKFLKEYRPTKLWAYLQVLEDAVRDGQQAGTFRTDVEPFVAAWALFGALDELGMQWVLSRKVRTRSPDDLARQVADTFLRGLDRAPDTTQPQEAP